MRRIRRIKTICITTASIKYTLVNTYFGLCGDFRRIRRVDAECQRNTNWNCLGRKYEIIHFKIFSLGWTKMSKPGKLRQGIMFSKILGYPFGLFPCGKGHRLYHMDFFRMGKGIHLIDGKRGMLGADMPEIIQGLQSLFIISYQIEHF